jgi:hypothetical protein
VLGKPLKKQENGKKTEQCECTVHAFQYTLLRLPDSGERA